MLCNARAAGDSHADPGAAGSAVIHDPVTVRRRRLVQQDAGDGAERDEDWFGHVDA